MFLASVNAALVSFLSKIVTNASGNMNYRQVSAFFYFHFSIFLLVFLSFVNISNLDYHCTMSLETGLFEIQEGGLNCRTFSSFYETIANNGS